MLVTEVVEQQNLSPGSNVGAFCFFATDKQLDELNRIAGRSCCETGGFPLW